MIGRVHLLPAHHKTEFLKRGRDGFHHERRQVPPSNLAILRQINELHPAYPLSGSSMLRAQRLVLRWERVAAVMVGMMPATNCGPTVSKHDADHKVCPCLPRDLIVDRPSQARLMNRTCIPMVCGVEGPAAVAGLAQPPSSVLAAADGHGGMKFATNVDRSLPSGLGIPSGYHNNGTVTGTGGNSTCRIQALLQ